MARRIILGLGEITVSTFITLRIATGFRDKILESQDAALV